MGPYRPLNPVGEHLFEIDILHGTGLRVKSHLRGPHGVMVQEPGVTAGTAVSPLASNPRRGRLANSYLPAWSRLLSTPPVLRRDSPNGNPAFSATMVRCFERARVGE